MGIERLSDPAVTPLQGENRILTLLFADITGSVRATAQLDAESAAELVNRALAEMAAPIFSYGGRVDRFLGDGMLAYFGAPEAHEDDPERAILAAVEIHRRLERLGLKATAGVNVGEVYLGGIGSFEHREITAMGPSVNLAARLQSSAKAGQTVVGEAVYRHAHRSFTFTPLRLEIKGLEGSLSAYQVGEALPRMERIRGLEGLHVEMVGRQHELEMLRDAMQILHHGSGRIAAIVGEAGLGKSRLLAELQSSIRSNSPLPLWLEGRCLSLTMSQSYAPFIDALRQYFRLPDKTEDRLRAHAVQTALSRLVESQVMTPEGMDDVAPILGRLFSIRFGNDWDRRLESVPPNQLKNRVFRSLEQLIGAVAREQPLVFALEDLHWADSLSIELTAFLLKLTASLPLFLICVSRPEGEAYTHLIATARSQHAGACLEVRLRELSDDDSRRLIDRLLQVEDFPESLRDRIMLRSQGNPFFVEEVVRSLLDSGLILRDHCRLRAKPQIDAFPIPEAVQAVIQGRVDRLSPASRTVLQLAAVIGRVFQRQLLETIVSTESDLDERLNDLRKRGLIDGEPSSGVQEYSFHHVLTQETVYHNLLRADRSRLHGEVAAAVESLYLAEIEAHYEQLAYHYEKSGIVTKAVDYLASAAEKTARLYLAKQAIEYAHRGLQLLAAKPFEEGELPWRTERSRQFNETLADVLAITAQHDAAQQAYREALEQTPAGNLLDRARLLRKSGDIARFRHKDDEAVTAFNAAEAALETGALRSADWWQEWIEVALTRIRFHYFRAQDDPLIKLVDRVADAVERHGSALQRGRLLDARLLAAFRIERYRPSSRTLALADQHMAAMREIGDPAKIGYAHFLAGFSKWQAGQLNDAAAHLRESLLAGERFGDAWLHTASMAYLITVYRNQGDLLRVRVDANDALQAAVESNMPEYQALAHANLAWLALREGRLEDAQIYALTARDQWRAFPIPSPFSWSCFWPLTALALEQRDEPAAIEHVRVMLKPEMQPQPDRLHRRIEEAVASWDAGDHRGARRSLEETLPLAEAVGYL